MILKTGQFILVFLTGIAACSFCLAQMVTATPQGNNSDKTATKGINRVPPLQPVMSSNDFQGKIKSITDDNFKKMTQQGFNSVQQQRDSLPQNGLPTVPQGSGNANNPASTNPTGPQQTSPSSASVPATPPETEESVISPDQNSTSTNPLSGTPPEEEGNTDNHLNIHY